MATRKEITAAVAGRWPRASRAPKPIRDVMKLGQIDRALTTSDRLAAEYERLDLEEFEYVRDLRALGLSWDSIGWFVGVTGSAVRQRFGDRVDQVVSDDAARM